MKSSVCARIVIGIHKSVIVYRMVRGRNALRVVGGLVCGCHFVVGVIRTPMVVLIRIDMKSIWFRVGDVFLVAL